MDNNTVPQQGQQLSQPQGQEKQPVEQPKKGNGEFSLGWHLKVLAVIYAVLLVLYIILTVTLK